LRFLCFARSEKVSVIKKSLNNPGQAVYDLNEEIGNTSRIFPIAILATPDKLKAASDNM